MKHVKISAFDCPDAWFRTLETIWNKGELFEVRYGSERAQTKKLNVSIEISRPGNRPLVDDRAPCDMKYVQWYALRYLWSGVIEDETYTYGSRLRKPVDQIEAAIKELEEAMKGDDKEVIEARTKTLTEASGKMAERLYAQQGDAAGAAEAAAGASEGAAESGSAAGDDVVDAEFEEVDDNKK